MRTGNCRRYESCLYSSATNFNISSLQLRYIDKKEKLKMYIMTSSDVFYSARKSSPNNLQNRKTVELR